MPLNQEQEEQKDAPLFDFIYVDRAKITSYISQLFNDGPLTSFSKTKSIDRSDKLDFGANVGFLTGARLTDDRYANSESRAYDPSWMQVLDFIESTTQQNFLKDINDAQLGQFIVFKGAIKVRDLRLMDGVWQMLSSMGLDLPAMLGLTETGKANTTKKQKNQEDNKRLVKFIFDMIKTLPQPLTLFSSNKMDCIWATLSPENMTINPMDFTLKHGAKIPGEWIILAVLDGYKDRSQGNMSEEMFPDVELGRVFDAVSGIFEQIGRPNDTYAVTPLAIFREIKICET